jgi:lipopolysaccharide export system permease protein
LTTILTRYIFRQLIVATFFVTIILTIAVWLTQSLRLVDVLINRGVPLTAFLKLVFLLLPDLVGIILPIGLLVAVLFTYSRLMMDNELIILRGAGVSDWRIIRPVLMTATLVTGLLYAINLYFLPLAFQNYKDLEFRIRNTVNLSVIQAGEFNTFRNIMVYVRSHQKNGAMNGILIHDARNPEKTYIVTAEFGKVINTPEGARLILVNGSRQERDAVTGTPSILTFDQYSVDLATQDHGLQTRQRKPYERFIHELFNPQDGSDDPQLRRKLAVEGHQRLIMPLTSIMFVLIALAVFLSGDYNRRGRSKRIILAVGGCAILEGLLLVLINLGEKSNLATMGAYTVLALAYIIPLTHFLRKSKNYSIGS